MAGRTCFHCKQWIKDGEAHDCWTTTEAALTHDLSEDLQEAWQRLRDTAVEFGEQRIYASHHSIMFSRDACYFFVRPRRRWLEVVFFLDRSIRAPQIRQQMRSSRRKIAHLVRVHHRDEVEAPLTDWLQDAFTLRDRRQARSTKAPVTRTTQGQKRGATRPRPPRRS